MWANQRIRRTGDVHTALHADPGALCGTPRTAVPAGKRRPARQVAGRSAIVLATGRGRSFVSAAGPSRPAAGRYAPRFSIPSSGTRSSEVTPRPSQVVRVLVVAHQPGVPVDRGDLDRAVLAQPRGGRDQLADDHVLLEAGQPVDLALDRGVGEHLRRLLEGGGREEALRGQRRLGDAQHLLVTRGQLHLGVAGPLALERGARRSRTRGPPRTGPAGTRSSRGGRRAPAASSGGRSPRCACR